MWLLPQYIKRTQKDRTRCARSFCLMVDIRKVTFATIQVKNLLKSYVSYSRGISVHRLTLRVPGVYLTNRNVQNYIHDSR